MAFLRSDVPEGSCGVQLQEGNWPPKDTMVRQKQGKAQAWKTKQNQKVWKSGETTIWI